MGRPLGTNGTSLDENKGDLGGGDVLELAQTSSHSFFSITTPSRAITRPFRKLSVIERNHAGAHRDPGQSNRWIPNHMFEIYIAGTQRNSEKIAPASSCSRERLIDSEQSPTPTMAPARARAREAPMLTATNHHLLH